MIEKYENEYKNKDWSEVGNDEQVEEIKSAFLKELDDAEFAMKTYIDINRSLRDVVKDDNKLYDELLKISDIASTYEEKLENINREFVAESVAKPEGFMNFLSPEKLISWLNRWFSSTSTVQIKSVQLLFRKANKALGRATFMTESANRKLFEVKDNLLSWASSKGLSNKELFSYIKKKDANELIDQYSPEFYVQLSKAIASSDITWMKENLDLEGVREELEKEKEKEYTYIKNKGGREGDIEQQAVDVAREQRQADKKFSIENESSLGWYLKDSLRKHPKKDV